MNPQVDNCKNCKFLGIEVSYWTGFDSYFPSKHWKKPENEGSTEIRQSTCQRKSPNHKEFPKVAQDYWCGEHELKRVER
ncbi:hypothetical protein LCGC14_1761880 [marine sediment metagenome]|uniref:Uncharacterized protein n=1 Tax=marine sediment metagenome TaxID=412755 RepID=A0A0F9HN59_9ZZZZ